MNWQEWAKKTDRRHILALSGGKDSSALAVYLRDRVPQLEYEAGNAWTSVKEFSPFNLKRSAGVGVRIYLPMVGMMGIDWAYGFDKVFGTKGGSHFHFILGQEF